MTLLLPFLIACATEPTPPAAPSPPPAAQVPAPPPAPPAEGPAPDSPEGQALARATDAGKAFGAALKARVKESIEAGGPPAAITVCSEDAPRIAAELASARGVTLGRSSLRLRNPANAGPDWVQAWLKEQGERSATGLATVRTIAQVDGHSVARVALPIPVEAMCLDCHGPKEGLSPEVLAALAERYPQDAATGYAEGDLRGVLWIEAPVAAAAPAAPAGG